MPPDLDAPDADGWTALHLAASRGNGPLADRLRAAGARPEPMDDGPTPADVARARGFPELAARLASGA